MGRERRIRLGAVAAGAALTLGLVTAISPRAAARTRTATPAATAQPATGITDGQYLRIVFSGFGPGIGLDFRECVAAPVTIATDCTALLQINRTPVNAITDNTGGGSAYAPAYSGSDPLLANDGGTGSITCDISHPCSIAVMPNPTDLTGSSLAQISFAPSTDSCPPPGAGAVVGSGSAAAYRAMYAWEANVCHPPESLAVQYSPKSSPDGVLSFLSGSTQYAITGPWSPDYKPVSAGSPVQTWDYAPLTMSSVVIAYRMYDLRGPQITNLTLTPDLLAAIFNGTLNDLAASPQVAALNPGIEFPSLLNTFVRAEHSSESWVFTSWLAATAPTVWTYGAQEIFPAQAGVTAATGSAAVGLDVLSNPNQTFAGQGTIGFMDSSTAAYYGLPTVTISNPDGTVTAATPATLAKAVAGATVNADGTVTAAVGDTSAWPMLLPTYLMAPTNQVTPANGTVLAALLRYAAAGGQAALPQGYTGLSPAMVTATTAVAAAIPTTAPTPAPLHVSPPPVAVAAPSGLGATTIPRLPVAHAPVATATARPASRLGAVSAVATGAPLVLTTDGAHLLLPLVAMAAVLAVIAGLATEGVMRLRSRTRPGDPPGHAIP